MSTALNPVRVPKYYEVINGKGMELPPPETWASEVANRICDELLAYGRASGLGRPRMSMLFDVPLPDDPTRKRAPDVSFTYFDRWPNNLPLPCRHDSVDVVPDLMVEVASPTDEAEDLLAKAHEYLRAGVRLVWLAYPRVRNLYAYDSPIAFRIFTAVDQLDGGTVLPGFSIPMAQLFPPVTDADPPETAADDD